MPASASAQLALDLRKFFAVVPTGSAGVGESGREPAQREQGANDCVAVCA